MTFIQTHCKLIVSIGYTYIWGCGFQRTKMRFWDNKRMPANKSTKLSMGKKTVM